MAIFTAKISNFPGKMVQKPNKTVQNERKKLLATWYNNFSIAVLVAGFLTPFWTIIYGTALTIPDDASRTLGFFICVIVGAFLRYLAWRALGSLQE